MTHSKLTWILVYLFALTLSVSCFAAGYHVYDWKGDAKVKKGKEIRESRWQPGYVLTANGERRVGKIMVTTINGRIAEVEVKGDGKRKGSYATSELKEFGLLLSVADIDKKRGSSRGRFGPGTLELADGQHLQGFLGAASLDNGVVFSIAYAPDRETPLTSYFSRGVKNAVMTIDGIEMEYLSGDGGFSKIPTLAEHLTFNH
jgi:hypothetical protein